MDRIKRGNRYNYGTSTLCKWMAFMAGVATVMIRVYCDMAVGGDDRSPRRGWTVLTLVTDTLIVCEVR